MPSAAAIVEKPRLYAELEDRLLARDQIGGSRIYYELLRRGRPLPEIMAEAVLIHAPYTHVPYHQRIDDGFPNFVNNDHCLLSARAAINLERMLPAKLAALPLAQTIWYIPSGLDIWNQKILKAPGHYATRGYKMPNTTPPAPVVYWPDEEPVTLDGPLDECRVPEIVARRPLEIPGRRQLEHAIEVARVADIRGVAKISDARVACRIVPTDIGGGIGRGVVADDQDEVLVGLGQEGVE